MVIADPFDLYLSVLKGLNRIPIFWRIINQIMFIAPCFEIRLKECIETALSLDTLLRDFL